MVEQDIIDLIFEEVGGNIPDAGIALDVGVFWNLNAHYAPMFHLRKALTKMQAIMYLLGQLRYATHASLGNLNPQLGERVANLQALKNMATEEIAYWKGYYRAARPPVIVRNHTRAMIERTNSCQPDPNSRRLRGDAIYGPINWQ